jgi:hypothetical protein
MVSGGMLQALNRKPYVDDGDDRDAIFSQMVSNTSPIRICELFINIDRVQHLPFLSDQTITLTLCVGLLSLSASNEDPNDWAFGLFLSL